ncbi:prephenate dehydratase [Nonlabens sp. MB-3u-79]|uniref:prephenate dehydratase n=1 Tax=Nonlabens sp. MB-3u-79 TaxID=2058134 RepID=UPI000C3072F8|nr:prephenate dehydratase [Nonlabens sp. MB-3u-79]AUC78347.1 prephenate dehydratase [Nonlabens sp. MB-3u-79]
MKIAIQGVQGSYHHQVASHLYGEVSLQECSSFDQLAMAVANGDADKGVMAIGNSIAGSILPNYSLIKEQKLTITGEFYLNINHQLMALHGQKIAAIDEVQSHPMALLQCQPFFRKHQHIKLVETDDTAAAACRIAKDKKRGVAAIASAYAAKLYGLKIIGNHIQQVKKNTTRFVVVEKTDRQIENANKATIHFTTGHQAGSLGKVLTALGGLNINLSKIQSLPLIEKPFLFSFVADLEFEDLLQLEAAQLEIGILVESLEVLGVYKSHKP